MMNAAIILIGMMGSGKSAVGRSLAQLTDRPFVDTDQLLQRRIGRPIKQMFDLYGEHSFREFETKILREMAAEPVILSTGGGIIMRPENWVELRRLGKIVYLRARAETLIDRLSFSRNKRPLLANEDWECRLREILSARVSLYEQADLVVDVDDSEIDAIANSIVDLTGAAKVKST